MKNIFAYSRSFVRFWRHSAPYAFLMMSAFAVLQIWWGNAMSWGVGLTCVWMLTVPCGILRINTDKRLWALRQTYFAVLATISLYSVIP